MYKNLAHALQNAEKVTYEVSDNVQTLYVDGCDFEQMFDSSEEACLYTVDDDTGEEYSFNYSELVDLELNNKLKVFVLSEATW
jgi:hypothetical protein